MFNDMQDQIINETADTGSSQESSPVDQNPLDICKAALADWQDKYARLAADFDNSRKRMAKEQASFALHAQATILTDLLTVVDNFDRAMAHQPATNADTSSWVNGIAMIHSAFKDLLSKSGVKEVSYDIFNPEFHEALMHADAPEKQPGEIVAVLEKGYLLGDRVLRPAKVSVAK